MHALHLFFSPSLPPHSPFSLFILPLCCVSPTTSLFYQINISQNKSQDNFKLVREEKRNGVRVYVWRGVSSVRATPAKWSLRLLPHLILRSAVLSFASAPCDEVVTSAHGCQKREQGQACARETRISTFVSQAKNLVDLISSSLTVQPPQSVLGATCDRSPGSDRQFPFNGKEQTRASAKTPRLKFSNTNTSATVESHTITW